MVEDEASASTGCGQRLERSVVAERRDRTAADSPRRDRRPGFPPPLCLDRRSEVRAANVARSSRERWVASARLRWEPLKERWDFGAGEGIRTLDPNLGKVVLYP